MSMENDAKNQIAKFLALFNSLFYCVHSTRQHSIMQNEVYA